MVRHQKCGPELSSPKDRNQRLSSHFQGMPTKVPSKAPIRRPPPPTKHFRRLPTALPTALPMASNRFQQGVCSNPLIPPLRLEGSNRGWKTATLSNRGTTKEHKFPPHHLPRGGSHHPPRRGRKRRRQRGRTQPTASRNRGAMTCPTTARWSKCRIKGRTLSMSTVQCWMSTALCRHCARWPM